MCIRDRYNANNRVLFEETMIHSSARSYYPRLHRESVEMQANRHSGQVMNWRQIPSASVRSRSLTLHCGRSVQANPMTDCRLLVTINSDLALCIDGSSMLILFWRDGKMLFLENSGPRSDSQQSSETFRLGGSPSTSRVPQTGPGKVSGGCRLAMPGHG